MAFSKGPVALASVVLATVLVGVAGMELKGAAFQQGEMIPAKYTCDGLDVSPPLGWSGPPAGTKSFALTSDDPDAPVGTWVHWVMWNIPASARSLEENLPEKDLEKAMQGRILAQAELIGKYRRQ